MMTKECFNNQTLRKTITKFTKSFRYKFTKPVFKDKFGNSIEDWDVSKVTNMNSLFKNCKNFNEDISKWDVSNVDNMSEMFSGAK